MQPQSQNCVSLWKIALPILLTACVNISKPRSELCCRLRIIPLMQGIQIEIGVYVNLVTGIV